MPTYSLHCSSFLGLPFGILNIELVKPKKGTTMETIGSYILPAPGIFVCFKRLLSFLRQGLSVWESAIGQAGFRA